MSKKSRSLLHTLQSQTMNEDEIINANSASMSYDNSQIRSLIENGGGDNNKDYKLASQLQELHKDCIQLLQQLNDQSVNCQIKQIISKDSHHEPQHIINHIRVFFQIIIQDKIQLEELLQKRSEGEQCDYEKQLQKLEAEVRQHIRIEQQLKIYAETTQAKLEDQVKSNESLENKINRQNEENKQASEGIKKFNLIIRQYENEIQNLKNETKKSKQSDPAIQKKELNSQDQKLRQDNYQKTINLPLDRLINKQENHKFYRVQTEPTEEFTEQNENYNYNNQQKEPYVQKRAENIDLNTQIIKQLLQERIQNKNGKTQQPIQTKIDDKLKRNGSSNQYHDASYLNIQKNKQEVNTRQKSLSKYSQNSIEVLGQVPIQSQNLHRTKANNSISTTVDITHPSFLRPFQSTDQPMSEIEGYQNEQRVRSRLQDGKVSSQGSYQTQNYKQLGESENSQQMKSIMQNYHMSKENENSQINRIVERQKKYVSKSQHY